ncbi:MAG: recombinase family protein [Candidatus Gastranaerophilaceae bacterium]
MRISTKEERSLQKFTRQEAALKKYAKDNKIEFLYIAHEDVSGKSFDNRIEWNKIDKLVHEGDTIVFKDISRFTREAVVGYDKYMELMNRGIELVFIDNSTVCTKYIKELLNVAEKQNLIAKISLENTIKLLLFVELDRVEQERLILIKRIKDGIESSNKKSGRPLGKIDKLTDDLKSDINKYLTDRSIKQIDLMNKHGISRNTLKKYITLIQNGSL